MVSFLISKQIGRSTRRIAAGVGLVFALTAPAWSQTSTALTQDLAKLSAASAAQRQALAGEIDTALRAGVADQDISLLVNQGAAKNYAAADIAQYVDKLAVLQRNGLPTTLVRDKMLEGMAKNVPASAVLQVATNWSVALEDANTALRGLEQRGLSYANAGERAALINTGATLQQRHGISQPLLALTRSSLGSGRIDRGAASISAAAELAEVLLLRGATGAQALALPEASLSANYSPQQIQALQRKVMDQLRQGIAVTDINAASIGAITGNRFAPVGAFPGVPGSPGMPGGPAAPGWSGAPGASGVPGGPAAPGGFGGPGGPGGYRH